MGGCEFCSARTFLEDWNRRSQPAQVDRALLREALLALLRDAPEGLECSDFHHEKRDQRHGPSVCPPKDRYEAALVAARAALAAGETPTAAR